MTIRIRPADSPVNGIECETVDQAVAAHRGLESLPPEAKEWACENPAVAAILTDTSLSRHQRHLRLTPHLCSLKEELRNREKAGERLRELEAALTSLKAWAAETSDLKLEKNNCSRLHRIADAIRQKRVIDIEGLEPIDSNLTNGAEVFVVEHDWAAAFKGATDYEGGEFNLPFPHCIFEFRFSGRNIVVVTIQPEGETPKAMGLIEANGFWICEGNKLNEQELFVQAWNQVRAISIALDAEVATHRIVRAPAALNAKRERDGKTPLYDYKVIELRGRMSRQRLPSMGGTHRSPRLHFRRGHWRHYDAHKTWIRWTLVGNPELGFIDKSYRL